MISYALSYLSLKKGGVVRDRKWIKLTKNSVTKESLSRFSEKSECTKESESPFEV